MEAVRKRVWEREVVVAYNRAQVAIHRQKKRLADSSMTEDSSLASTYSGTRLDNPKVPGSWTTTGHSHTHDSRPPGNSPLSVGSSIVHSSSNYHPAVGSWSPSSFGKFRTLSYFTELDGDGDNQVQSLKGIDLYQLRDFAAKEENAERNVEQTKSASDARYIIFLETCVMDDLDRAICRAKEQIPINFDSADYTSRLKHLIVMLKKYKLTGSLDDLQEAVYRAQEMTIATPLEHLVRPVRMADWINITFRKFGRTGSQDDLDAIITAREAGVEIFIDNSDSGGALRLQVGIPK